jgi:hypothetical protein
MAFTVTAMNSVLNKIFRNTDFTPATTLYLSLHTANPTDSGTSEVTGGSYARQTVAFDAAATSHTQNTGAVSFTNMPATTVTHFAIFSAVSSGTLWVYGALSASKTTTAGDTLTFAIGDIDFTLA